MAQYRTVDSLSALADEFDEFLIDQFGVLHDGMRPYQGATECLARLKELGKNVVLLSNSGKRVDANIVRLADLGFERTLFDHVALQRWRAAMEYYVGLDVSLKQTSICVVDQAGLVVREGVVDSDPEAISVFVRSKAPGAVRIGLETGPTSTWLWTELKRLGLPVICIDARHVAAAQQVLECAEAQQAAHLEREIREHRHRHGEGDRAAKDLVEWHEVHEDVQE